MNTETIPTPATDSASLLHLRITGRHGIFLIQRGTDPLAMVDTREAIICTCGQGECEHVGMLRACGFLQGVTSA